MQMSRASDRVLEDPDHPRKEQSDVTSTIDDARQKIGVAYRFFKQGTCINH